MRVDHSRSLPDDTQSVREVIAPIVLRATRLRIAVAFVTDSGVDKLLEWTRDAPGLAIEVVARGAPITDPDALVALSDHGATVSVIIGGDAAGYHPKLWLFDEPGRLSVLSGSGNLTSGGLLTNREQFELLEATDPAAIAQQKTRFSRLTRGAVSLEAVRATTYWTMWRQQGAERHRLNKQAVKLDETLARSAEAAVGLAALRADLLDLYERAKEVRLPTTSGGSRPYVASRFKQAIDRVDQTGGPVRLVADMVKSPTEGFGILAAARRPDLMVETLVIDTSKAYHPLFEPGTVAAAHERLEDYTKSIDDAPRAANGQYRTQNITAKDVAAGQIRLPRESDALLPGSRASVDVVVFNQTLPARWDPRVGPPKRSGMLSFGKGRLDGLVSAGGPLLIYRDRDGSLHISPQG